MSCGVSTSCGGSFSLSLFEPHNFIQFTGLFFYADYFCYQVGINQPLGDMGTLAVEFQWPFEVANGKWLLYLTKIVVTGESETECKPAGKVVNELNLTVRRFLGQIISFYSKWLKLFQELLFSFVFVFAECMCSFQA